jgi:2-octaprenyl-6-methoxyphenol hydroxylase
MTKTANQESIVVIGGGPVGLTFALALRMQGIEVTILEARAKGAYYDDQRALALSEGTRKILDSLKVWSALAPVATPIETIHISQKGSFGRSLLRAQDSNLPALGYVLSYGALMEALDDVANEMGGINTYYGVNADTICPGSEYASVSFESEGINTKLTARLLVLSDGGKNQEGIDGIERKTKWYGHDAIVTKVKTELPHRNVAYERFTPMGPVALLPNGSEYSLVWTGKADQIKSIMNLDDESFLEALHQHFGDRVGKFESVGKRITFPLKLSYLTPVISSHLVVIGNAAQTMHPVAGQGFNVGLRDAFILSQEVINNPLEHLGTTVMLERYQLLRKRDTKRGLLFTDILVNLFSNDLPGISSLRAAGLGLFELVGPAKSFLVKKMSFGSRG